MRFMLRDLLLIFAAGLAEVFLLWTLWNFLKAGRRRPSTGGSWKLNEGQKTRHSVQSRQDQSAPPTKLGAPSISS
jgi:hypothetical protein